MTDAAPWRDIKAHLLVRYEALVDLLDAIQLLDDIEQISKRIASQWKYFANATNWRLVLPASADFLVIDGSRGTAQVSLVASLDAWDARNWQQQLPQRSLLPLTDNHGLLPPDHLLLPNSKEIMVLPFARDGICIGLLSMSAHQLPFNDLDMKFIPLMGRQFASRVADILLRQQATQALMERATRDSLTGLFNRGAILERLSSQLALARRTQQALSVILLDIDHFKVVNDTYGHAAGDDVLREIARRLLNAARDGDHVGRYGGEEFLIVLYPCNQAKALCAAERFRQGVAESSMLINAVLPAGLPITISLGVASAEDCPPIGAAELIDRADHALYTSKSTGRNCVTAFIAEN
jgi:diguanylate cyclase (GGDEF)-like protein